MNFLACWTGSVLMLIALVSCSITLWPADYRGALLLSLTCTILAMACFAVPVVRGPVGWRVVGCIFSGASLYVFVEFARRAPHVW
jgi:hypothetical protein